MAETAERDADRALLNARTAVRHARDEVKRLEREAAEEYVNPISLFLTLKLTVSQDEIGKAQAQRDPVHL
jgi:hypothetical protein